MGPKRCWLTENAGSPDFPKNPAAVLYEGLEGDQGDAVPVIVITSADAIKIEHEPRYDRRGDEDLACAGVLLAAVFLLFMFLCYLAGGLL